MHYINQIVARYPTFFLLCGGRQKKAPATRQGPILFVKFLLHLVHHFLDQFYGPGHIR